MANAISNSRRYPAAGYLTLIAHLPDGSDSTNPADIYTSGRVVMGAINTSYSTTQTPLDDENSLFPAANYTTGSKSTLTVEFNTKDPRLQAFLKGAEQREVKNFGQWCTNIERTVKGDATPATKGTVVLAGEDGTPLKIGTARPVLVRDVFTNDDFKLVTTQPQKGEFKVDAATGTLSFAKEDVDSTVHISCELIAAEAVLFEMAAKPKTRTFTAILSGPDEDHNEVNPKWVTETFDKVQISGDVNDLVRSKAPGKWSATFETGKPRPGKKAVTVAYTDPLLDLGAFNG